MEPRHEIVGARSTFWRETHFLRQLFSAVRNIHKTKSATCFHCCRAHQRYSQTIAIPLSLSWAAIYKFNSPFGCVITADGAIIYFLRLLFLAAVATQLTKQCTVQSVVRTLLGSGKFSHWKLKQRNFCFHFILKVYKFKANPRFFKRFRKFYFPEKPSQVFLLVKNNHKILFNKFKSLNSLKYSC